LVVIATVRTVGLCGYIAGGALPAVFAAARPAADEVRHAAAPAAAAAWATLQRAVAAVPAGDAKAVAATALPVGRATVVAGALFAVLACPAFITDAGAIFTPE